MPRQSPYQTKGVGYGSFSNPNMHLNLANNYNGQLYTNQYSQPGQIHQNVHSGAFYQPTGINQGMYMTYERQRSSSSSSRSSNKSPSRLEQWKRRRMMKKQGVVYTPAMQGEQPGRMQNIKNRINNALR